MLTVGPLDAILVEPDSLRQPVNDTGGDQLWLIVGAPQEPANTLEMAPETIARLYPDGPKLLPPELRFLARQTFDPDAAVDLLAETFAVALPPWRPLYCTATASVFLRVRHAPSHHTVGA